MVVREITTATIIEDGVQVHLRDVDHAAEVEAQIGTRVGVGVPDVEIGTGGDRPQEPHPHPLGIVLDLTHVHLPLVVPGHPGRTHPPPGEILEATAPCHHLQGAVHHRLLVVTAAARLAVIAGHVHLQGPLRGHGLPKENAVVPLPLVLRCQ